MDASKGRDVKAAEQTTVEFADGVLRIEASTAKNRMLGNTGSIEVTVQLPAGSHVEAKTAGAGFWGVGRLGDVVFEGAQGAVEVDEAASVRLTVLAGDVTVGRLGGAAEISTQKGDIHITEAVRGTSHCGPSTAGVVGATQGVSPPWTPAPATAGSTTHSRTPRAPPS